MSERYAYYVVETLYRNDRAPAYRFLEIAKMGKGIQASLATEASAHGFAARFERQPEVKECTVFGATKERVAELRAQPPKERVTGLVA